MLEAQSPDTVPNDTVFNYKQDYILRKIIPVLHQGWTFTEKDGEFIIEKDDSIYIADRRKLNIPYGKKIPDDTILKFGTKAKSAIIYSYEKRWSFEQILAANTNNTDIFQQLKKISEKYNINSLIDKSKSTKENVVYIANTDKEKAQLEQYEKEKKELLSKLITKPKYHTEKYSLFLKSTYGCNNDFFSVYPAEASIQLYDILILFNELTEKSN